MNASTQIYSPSPPISPSRRDAERGHRTAEDLIRITPRGVRTAVEPLARGERPLEQMPDYALQWLKKHGAIEPAEKSGVKWKRTPLLRSYLTKIAARYR